MKISALISILLVLGVAGPASATALEMCGNRPNTADKTCVVDGDTLWLNGENIRLKDFDTPEPQTQICGGASEVALAHQAVRLQGFWDNLRCELTEALAHQVFHIRRLLLGEASGAV